MGIQSTAKALCLALYAGQAVAQVHLPVTRQPRASRYVKRDGVAGTAFTPDVEYKDIGAWLVNVTFGTPGQTVAIQLDTGSSDLWAYAPGVCELTNKGCQGGSYDPMGSSTAILTGEGAFNITYGGGAAAGDYITDTVEIGGLTVEKQLLAVARSSKTENMGIFGIGYASNEAIVSQGGEPYDNLLTSLTKSGAISSMAYSVYMDGSTGEGGLIIGGYDSEKYSGDLFALEIQKNPAGVYDTVTVVWSFFGINDGSEVSIIAADLDAAVLMDTGTSLVYFPPEMYDGLIQLIGFQVDETVGPYVPCKAVRESNSTFVFGFGGSEDNIISVPVGDLVEEFSAKDNPTDSEGNDLCGPGFMKADDGTLIFGDTFLKSAYLVVDYTDNVVYMGQSNFNGNSNIQAFGGSDNTTPLATATATATAVASGTGYPDNGGYSYTQVPSNQTLAYTATAVAPTGAKATGVSVTGAAGAAGASSTKEAAAGATGVVDVSKLFAVAAVAAAGIVGL